MIVTVVSTPIIFVAGFQTALVTTVFFFSFVLRNKADVSLFWEIWGHQRLPSDHKIGRKLPFGKKHHLMSFAIIQEDDGPKEEFQDEPI